MEAEEVLRYMYFCQTSTSIESVVIISFALRRMVVNRHIEGRCVVHDAPCACNVVLSSHATRFLEVSAHHVGWRSLQSHAAQDRMRKAKLVINPNAHL